MLKYLGPDIRVHNFKKNSKLFASISATQCSLPFCLQQVIPTNPEVSTPLRPGSSYSPKAEGSMLFVGEREICPCLMSQESDSCTQFSGSVKTVL